VVRNDVETVLGRIIVFVVAVVGIGVVVVVVVGVCAAE
jgi:uncharacterized membrane protein